MPPPLRLILTGMHRSGTSLVASLLAAWNVRMGDKLVPADRGNPAGYFEDVDFLELDRRILLACTPPEDGHRDWGWTESENFDDGPLPAHRNAAAALVAARDRAGSPWGWKDPRTSMLLDFWDDVLGSDACFLFLYRHPWEVADSMLRTGAGVWLTHPGYPARIWTRYNRRILDFHRRHADRTLLVSTNQLLRDPEAFAATIRRRFGIEADPGAITSLHAEDSFVSRPDDDPLPRLWHYTNAEAIDLLGALDDAADLGNDRKWEAASSRRAPRPEEPPRLSVIIPCHDDGDYLIDAVASVERNAPAAELIVVDDGSTQPRTLEVLAALREAGHRVIEQPQSGLSAARNRGIAASAGDHFLPLDADNRLLPDFVAEAVAQLDADPAAGVVYGDRREFGARSGDIPVPELDLPRLLWSNYIDACAVVRRTVWSDCNGYDVAFTDWEDWDFWLSAAARCWRFVHLSRPTFEYRIRPDSVHQRFLRRDDYPSTLRRIYDKHRDLVSEHAAEILIAAHIERRQLFADAAALRASRDGIQVEIDRLALGTREQIAAVQEIVAARDEELASVKFVLQAREEELAALRNLQFAPSSAANPSSEAPLTNATRVFTIVARNYLAYARVLAASLARHNPGARLHVVVLDDPGRTISPEPSFEVIHADELPFDPPSDFYTMAAIYDVTELSTAVKPWVFEYLFGRGASVAIYLDPDIEVFDSLGPLEPLSRKHGMLLTPHITEPLPRDGKRPDERDLLLAGIYNLGFLALSAEAARSFLPWWRKRLRRDCLSDPAEGLFVDQRWIDFAPALFAPVILKDPGYNIAYWNLPHRVLTRDGDRIHVNGRPLRFIHFSGFSPRARHLLSKHQHASPRVLLSETPLLAELCERYAAALEEAGFARCSGLPYGFAVTAGGLPLDARTRKALRRTYLEDEAGGRAPSFPNPFSRAGAGDVVQRLLRPSTYAPGVPAWLAEIWSDRADLRLAFPRIESVDAERFLDWARTQGIREHDIPPQLIPPRVDAIRTPAARGRKLPTGVNVYGYAFAESGTGQIVRAVVAALAAEGIPYAVVPFTRTISRQQREFRDLGTAAPTFDTNLICVNADQVPLFFESMRGQLLPGARNIGLWAWEVEDLPSAMAGNERYLDEVWGISSFTAAALSRCLTKRVRAFPLPVVVPNVRRRTRAELGMPERFLFLVCFDYDSVFQRKNPLAAVAAFRRAFPDRTDVVLYIKTTNAERHAAEDEALRAAAASCANIVIRDRYVTSDDYFSMLEACDCYVSLHRSEGFGLTVAEAMALGKPVISTAYSSTLEFANESNSFPVPARIVEVGNGAPPYPPHSRWADPDVVAAAEQMARVYNDRGNAAAVGARARVDIEALHGPSARGPLLRRLLDESRGTHRAFDNHMESTAFARPAEVTMDPLQPSSLQLSSPHASSLQPLSLQPLSTDQNGLFESEAMAVESLLGSPRPNLPSPMQRLMTPLRRLVLRCIRVYWVQQLAVNRALLAAMRTLRRESRGETASHAAMLQQQRFAQDRIDNETSRMREELTELTADVRALYERIGATAPFPRPQMRAKAGTDGDQDSDREDGQTADRERKDG
ncbi:MAG TPA: glycosyltransferase [Thermoanaerobaculia bacterium]|nr:glycosyltransferase [Thermoanaerobaculia bacterium]